MTAHVRSARRKLGLTQKQLGEMVGVSQAAVSLWERGEGGPSVEILPRLAEALSVPVEDLPVDRRLSSDYVVTTSGTQLVFQIKAGTSWNSSMWHVPMTTTPTNVPKLWPSADEVRRLADDVTELRAEVQRLREFQDRLGGMLEDTLDMARDIRQLTDQMRRALDDSRQAVGGPSDR